MPMRWPSRFWSRYSLRGLLLVITLFACVLGYYCNWIHQRRAFLAQQAEIYASNFRPPRISEALSRYYHDKATEFAAQQGPSSPVNAPPVLALLGESGVVSMSMAIPPSNATQVRVRCWEVSETHPHIVRARSLFPEAIIHAYIWDTTDPNHPELRSVRIVPQSFPQRWDPTSQSFALAPKR
jgi:hypothetical protein